MTRYADCGKLPPARKYDPYCPVCEALQAVPQDDDDLYDQGVTLIFDKCDRISRLHQQYRQKSRH